MSRNEYHFCPVCLGMWKISWKTVYWFCMSFIFSLPDLKMLLNSSKINCPVLLISFYLCSYSMLSYTSIHVFLQVYSSSIHLIYMYIHSIYLYSYMYIPTCMFSYLCFINIIKGYDYKGNFYVETTCITLKKSLHILSCVLGEFMFETCLLGAKIILFILFAGTTCSLSGSRCWQSAHPLQGCMRRMLSYGTA